jgi:UDPglucose 6-dehydrogenase
MQTHDNPVASPGRNNGHGGGRGVSARIAVVGCGHVGLVVAAGMAKFGHDVIGVDVREELVQELCSGEVRILERDLPDLVRSGVSAGNLSFTTNYDLAIPDAEFIFLAVDTPPTIGGAADMRNLRLATRSIGASLNGFGPIIVNKATAPIGTADTIQSILDATLGPDHALPRLVANPEFLRQGHAVHDFFNPDRIVVGSRSHADAMAVAGLYRGVQAEVIVTDLRTAEMIKYVSNSFLATRISFINEVARLCEQIGVDIDQVVAGVALDERIGGHYLRPGIGYGGSCLPKDVAALRYIGETHGVATSLLGAVQEVNLSQKARTVSRLRSRLGSLDNRTIAVWGLSFKGGTEDLRDSPAMEVVNLLRNEGAEVRLYDPAVIGPGALLPHGLREYILETPVEAASGADALAVLSDWDEFARVPLADVRGVMRGTVIFDGRNVLDKTAAEALGFSYIGVGRIATQPRRRHSDP